MVRLFLLPMIAKIPTDCLILIGCWKVSLNLIGCLKSYHAEQNGAHHWIGEVLGYILAPVKSLYPFLDSLYLLIKCVCSLIVKCRNIWVSDPTWRSAVPWQPWHRGRRGDPPLRLPLHRPRGVHWEVRPQSPRRDGDLQRMGKGWSRVSFTFFLGNSKSYCSL